MEKWVYKRGNSRVSDDVWYRLGVVTVIVERENSWSWVI